jgi:hypothetical protein
VYGRSYHTRWPIVSFICTNHLEAAAAEHDARRTAWLADRGYRVMRFRNHEVDEDVQRVVEMICPALEVADFTPLPPPPPARCFAQTTACARATSGARARCFLQGEGAGWG